MKPFVTGGSGFVGSHLIKALHARGMPVHALARSDRAAEIVHRLGATPVAGDLEDRASLEKGMAGSDTVFHCAGLLEVWNAGSMQEAVNVKGTRNVIDACRRAGVECLVSTSAAAVLSEAGAIRAGSEDVPIPDEPYGDYARTKAIAEQMVLAANGNGLRSVAIRPPAIWGVDDQSLLPEIAKAVRRRQFVWVNGGRYPYDTCHVRNVCEGAILAAKRGRGGQSYFLTDPEKVTFREFVTGLLETAGLRPRALSVPRAAAWPAAALLESGYRLLRLKARPPITRALLALIASPIELGDRRARNELGYVGRVTREAGLAELRSAPAES